jgi:prolyl-tRNA editing enzyme YbaK/EbsC (Cys-tRNA(Pro) deacylase)
MELEEGHQRREAQELDANHGTVRLDEVDLYLGKMAKTLLFRAQEATIVAIMSTSSTARRSRSGAAAPSATA